MASSPLAALRARAIELHAAGKAREAEAAYEQVLATDPADGASLAALAGFRLARGLAAEALALCDRALAHDPVLAAALINRGNALRALGRFPEALESYDRCVAAHPQHAQAWSNRAVLLADLRRHGEAVESCDRALALAPGLANAHNNRGISLAASGRPEEAIASYDRALAVGPPDAGVLNNRALALMASFRMGEALESAERALALQPAFAPAHFTRGTVLKDVGRLDEALQSFETAARAAPGIPYVLGARLFARMQLCQWDDIEALQAEVQRGIAQGRRVMHPWALLATPATATLQRRCAETFIQDRWPTPARALPRRARQGPLRVGYFSADFHGHATAYLLAEVIELHDRERIHATAFSFGPPSQGPMRERLERAFDEFIDVSRLSDAAIAALSRERGIDIAVDLKGLTQDSRPGIFAARAAPVQVNYLGHPGTLGAPFVDCLIADETIVPPAHEAHYTERVLRMPGCYQPNDRRRPIAPQAPGREALGLPAQGFVFCCFNATYKISPDVFAVWMRLLARVEGSVLWLLRPPESAMGRLRAAASAAGVDPARLVFAPPLDLPLHLARLREADLFLDTFHCGAHTTASDALWAGVPLVTRLGETFASRIAASLLRAAGLPELVTDSAVAYEALALHLARSGERLAELRRRLGTQGRESPLFDTPRYTRELEALYLAMA